MQLYKLSKVYSRGDRSAGNSLVEKNAMLRPELHWYNHELAIEKPDRCHHPFDLMLLRVFALSTIASSLLHFNLHGSTSQLVPLSRLCTNRPHFYAVTVIHKLDSKQQTLLLSKLMRECFYFENYNVELQH